MNTSNSSDEFGNILKTASEDIKIFPNISEINFVPIRKPSERKQSHTLTVREVARIFEDQELPISEHTVTNWCKQNSQGICRLDGFYDEAERRWYITPESVNLAIKEERTRLRKDVPNPSEAAQSFSETFGSVPNTSSEYFRTIPKASETDLGKTEKTEEKPHNDTHQANSEAEGKRIRDLEQELFNLKILNAGKDAVIKEFEKAIEREREDRMKLVEVVSNGHRQLDGAGRGELMWRSGSMPPPRGSPGPGEASPSRPSRPPILRVLPGRRARRAGTARELPTISAAYGSVCYQGTARLACGRLHTGREPATGSA